MALSWRVLLLVLVLGALSSCSEDAPVSGSYEECCPLNSNCQRLGLVPPRLCLLPPCERWNLDEICDKEFGSPKTAQSSSKAPSNSDISPTPQKHLLPSSEKEKCPDVSRILKSLAARGPQQPMPKRHYQNYPEVPMFKNRLPPFMKPIPLNNVVLNRNPDMYDDTYVTLRNSHLPQQPPKPLQSNRVRFRRLEPNELHFRVTLPFPAKEFLAMALPLFYQHQSSNNSGSSQTQDQEKKEKNTINVTAIAGRIDGIDTNRNTSGEVKKGKDGIEVTYRIPHDTPKKRVSKRSVFDLDVDNRLGSYLGHRDSVEFVSARSDGYGLSASSKNHGSAYAFGNGKGVSTGGDRVPHVRLFPQLPSMPIMPRTPFFYY